MSQLHYESVALIVCCTISMMHCNLLHYEYVALSVCWTISLLHCESVALWICCTNRLLHYQSVALWPGHRAVTRWAQHIWAFASQPSTWSGRCAIKRGVSIHRGTRHSTVFKYSSHSGATRARCSWRSAARFLCSRLGCHHPCDAWRLRIQYLLGWFCY